MVIGAFTTDPKPIIGAPEIPGRILKTLGGCSYYRVALPLRELHRQGYDTMLAEELRVAADGHVQLAGSNWKHPGDRLAGEDEWVDPDVIIFQRWMHRAALAVTGRARACGQIVLNDVDDDFFSLPVNHPAREVTDPVRDPDENRAVYRQLMAASDGLICSTQPLADTLEDLGVPTFVCRNAIELPAWRILGQPETLRVGWIGSSAWRANDLAPLVGVLGPFLKRYGGEFVHLGHLAEYAHLGEIRPITPVWEQLQIPGGVRVTAVPLQPITVYPDAWEGISLVVVPLEDCPFNHSKSWLRGLEASAHGLPFIATGLPEYRALGCGRLANRHWEWRRELKALLDRDVRNAEGLTNRKRAEELSIERMISQWIRVLDHFDVPSPAVEAAVAA